MSARVITRPWRTQPPGGYRFNRDSHLARLARFAHVFTPQATVDLTGNGSTLAPAPNLIGYVGGPLGLGWECGAQSYKPAITSSGLSTFNADSDGFWVLAVLNRFTSSDGTGGVIVGYSGSGKDGLGASGGNSIWYWFSGTRLTGPAIPVSGPVTVGGWYDATDAMLFVNGQFVSGSNGGFAPSGRSITSFGGQDGQSALRGNIAAVFAGWGKPPNEFFLRMWENPWQVFEPRRIVVPGASAGGSVYEVSITETAAVSDSVSALAALIAQLSEAAAASDSVAGSLSIQASISETVTASDAVAAALSIQASVTESVSAGDSVSAQLDAVGSVLEAGSASDSVSSSAVLVASVAESGSASDSLAIDGNNYAASISESATAGDSYSAQLVAAVGVTESVNASDALSAQAVLVGAVDESAAASDAVSSQLDGVAGIAESAAAGDSYSASGGTPQAPQTPPPRPPLQHVGGSMAIHP